MSRLFRATAALLLVLITGAGAALAQDASPATEPGTASPEPMSSPAAGTTTSPAPAAPADGATLVSAIEYEFVGVPANVPAGTTFQMQNEGQELHEFAVVRRNEGTDQPVEELLAMGDAAFELVTFVGVLFAEPGQMAEGTVVLAEPGQYIAVCNIPVGTTSLADLGGPSASADPAAAASPVAVASPAAAASPMAGASPAASPGAVQTHADLGMIVEFTVGDASGTTTDAGASPAAGADSAESPAAVGAASPLPTAGA